MMFLPSRQAGFGRITAQIGALWLVTKGGFKNAHRERERASEKEREGAGEGGREAQMVGRIATLKKTPTHTAQLGSAILI